MAYTLSNKCANNICKQTVLLLFQLIIKNVVTCFLEHNVDVSSSFLSCSLLQKCIGYKSALVVTSMARGYAYTEVEYVCISFEK